MNASHTPPVWTLHTHLPYERFTHTSRMSSSHTPPVWALHTHLPYELFTHTSRMSSSHTPPVWALHTHLPYECLIHCYKYMLIISSKTKHIYNLKCMFSVSSVLHLHYFLALCFSGSHIWHFGIAYILSNFFLWTVVVFFVLICKLLWIKASVIWIHVNIMISCTNGIRLFVKILIFRFFIWIKITQIVLFYYWSWWAVFGELIFYCKYP